jgi:hypothetical protein
VKFHWGKYKGFDIQDVPEEYLRSTVRWSEKNIQDCNAELDRRAAVEDAGKPWAERIVSVGYRELAKRFHPDLHEGTEAQMKAINNAAEFLREFVRQMPDPPTEEWPGPRE